MDGPPVPDAPPPSAAPNGETPYRSGQPLAEIIPRDTRRQKTIALIATSMIAGVCLWQLGGWALDAYARHEAVTPPAAVTPGYFAGRIHASVLHGPGGDLAMPPSERTVIHVWLQGCADCMSAFEAMYALESNGGLGVRVPIVNVAYGEADLTWAHHYRVDKNLVFDPAGANVVKPLGIGSFTTLVVDADGVILHRDRPDRPGYRDRVRAAVGAGNVDPDPVIDPDDPLGPRHDGPPPAFDSDAVARVVASHRSSVQRTCWSQAGNRPRAAKVSLTLSIGPDGRVVTATSDGDDPETAACIENMARTWRFPSPGSTTAVHIPFKFVRE